MLLYNHKSVLSLLLRTSKGCPSHLESGLEVLSHASLTYSKIISLYSSLPLNPPRLQYFFLFFDTYSGPSDLYVVYIGWSFLRKTLLLDSHVPCPSCYVLSIINVTLAGFLWSPMKSIYPITWAFFVSLLPNIFAYSFLVSLLKCKLDDWIFNF